MDINELKKNWNEFGATDPMWAILTESGKKGNQWSREDFFKAGVDEIDRVMKSLESLGIDLKKRAALDFGCGVGRLSQALAGFFDKVYGVDIAASMIRQAEIYNGHGDRCSFVLNEVDNLSRFESGSFDFIYTNIVLQHMKPKYSLNYIKEFMRILDQGGVLVFQLPSERKRRDSFARNIIRKVLTPELMDKIFYLRLDLQARFSKEPRMEMYSVHRDKVVKFLQDNGATVVDVRDDPMNHGLWKSHVYYAVKK